MARPAGELRVLFNGLVLTVLELLLWVEFDVLPAPIPPGFGVPGAAGVTAAWAAARPPTTVLIIPDGDAGSPVGPAIETIRTRLFVLSVR